MFALFQRKLFKNWLMILGWGIGLAVLGYFLLDIYDTMFVEDVNIVQIMEIFPEEVMAFFGGSDVNIYAPEGFLHIEFFSYMPIILGIMAITSATSLIVKKEEDGTLELILTQPISRTAVFWSKLLALILSLILIMAIIWCGFALGLERVDRIDIDLSQLVLSLLSLFAVLLVFLSLALFLGMVLPSSGAASLVTGFLLIASWFITSLTPFNENLEPINRFSPMRFYQGGGALAGFNQQHFFVLMGISLVFIVLAWVLFERRDLRFGGKGWLRVVFPKKSN